MVKRLKLHFDENPISLALIALLFGGVCIGFSPIFVRLSETGPTSSAFWRVLLVLPLFYMTMVRNTNKRIKNGENVTAFKFSKKIWWGLTLSGFLFAADLAFWHSALQYTTVANATLLSNLMPILVAVGAHFLFKEHLTPVFYMGLALALIGAVVLAGNGSGQGRLLGDGLAVVTAVFYGAYILSVRWLRRDVGTSAIMFWTGVVSVVFLLPLAVATGEVVLPTSAYGWYILFGLAFISQFVGQGLITYSLAHLPAAFGAVSLLVQPVVAAALAWNIFGEALGPWEFLGATVILTGIVLARLGAVPKPT